MRITLYTLFPEWFTSPLSTSLLGRAVESGLLEFHLINPRQWSTDRHQRVDDSPYGGGPGMIMMLEPLIKALRDTTSKTDRCLLLSARGRPLTQEFVRDLAKTENLSVICGRYEGIDARISQLIPLEEVCVGDVVLNGGESAAMILVEAVARLIPGFMGKEESGKEESFSDGLLEYPHFTHPEVFEDHAVPEILLSGDHARIAQWRREQSLLTTWQRRPELLDEAPLTDTDLDFLRQESLQGKRQRLGRNLSCALVHYPVYLGDGKCGTSSLTNLDVHDIARCSCTYGLRSFIVVTPLEDQRHLLQTLVGYWTDGAGGVSNPDRAEAMRLVQAVDTVQQATQIVEEHSGERPFVIGTSAKSLDKMPRMTPSQVRKILRHKPVLLLFGTGHGLAQQMLESCDAILRPLRWMDTYNHLSVRGAVAITLDRILGDLELSTH